jgi:RNA polymerase sigma factor for flagellar operon FliA
VIRHATLGRLWVRYLEKKGTLVGGLPCDEERRALEREANGLRDRLLVNYSPLVRYVAGRISGRTTYPLEYEDVISWGVLGLLDAVETYDPGRGTKFESYAISKIRWSILDELRKADPLPRRLRLRAQQVEGARAALAQRLGRSPTETEVARDLGVGLPEHRAFLVRCQRAQVASLEARVEYDGVPYAELHELVGDRAATDPASAAEMAEVRSRLAEAIGTLSERERIVTTFYFYEGLTLREIGKALGLTEGRISQILRRALCNLRDTLAEHHQPSAG